MIFRNFTTVENLYFQIFFKKYLNDDPNDFILEIESSKSVQKLCKRRNFSKICFLRYGLVGGRYN